jgi:PAS domain S-box-containing protein
MNHRENSSLSRDDLLQQLTKLKRDNRELRARLSDHGAQSDSGATSASRRHAHGSAPADAWAAEPKHSRDALEASEGWLRALVESATDYAIISLDLTGRVTSWNAGARNILGWEEHEAIGRYTDFLFTPEDKEAGQPRSEIRNAIAYGRAEDERWHVKKDGSRFWAKSVLMPFQNSELVGFLKILRDQTREKRADQRARDSEEQLRAIMESISDAFYALDAQMRFIYVNHQAAEIWGKRVEDLIGRAFTDAFPVVVGTEQWGFHERVRQTREPLQVETRSAIIGRWLSASFYPGVQGGVTVYFRDITDQKETRDELARGRERILEILESISDAFYAVDREWRFTYINRKAEELWGCKREDLIGKVYPEMFPQIVGSASFNAHVRVMDERVPIRHEVVSPILHHWVDINIYPTADGGLSVYFRDATERKKAEEHQRLLIHELNHRVKNTLATVQSIASQTLRNAQTTQEANQALESRLFALSRVHDVLTRENWEAASLHEIVAQAVEPYRSHVESRIQFAGPTIRVPPRMALALAMALQELATNAVKYGALSNESGQVGVRWSVDGNATPPCLRIRWEETGGPPVQAPKRRGFGTRLIERSLAHDPDAKVEISFAPAGIICKVETPLR